ILKSLSKTAYLSLFIILLIIFQFLGIHGIPVFIFSSLAILGIVVIIGKATEEISLYYNPVIAGIINATFGNITEMIISIIALIKGETEVALSSIIGSIIANLLLLFGLAMITGGIKYKEQQIGTQAAQSNITLLGIILLYLTIPSIILFSPLFDNSITPQMANSIAIKISLLFSILILITYGLSLYFSLKTHKSIFLPEGEMISEKPQWPLNISIIILLLSTIAVAFSSHMFVESIEEAHKTLGWSKFFIGGIVAAIVGNAAEGAVAIWVAKENKISLSFQVAISSCTQVGLLVAPALIITSFLIGKPLALQFNIFEIIALFGSFIVAFAALVDGKTNWFEGLAFVITYLMISILYFFHP
ncbi:MAG: calcium/proton exchanger, partial [bacterium]